MSNKTKTQTKSKRQYNEAEHSAFLVWNVPDDLIRRFNVDCAIRGKDKREAFIEMLRKLPTPSKQVHDTLAKSDSKRRVAHRTTVDTL